jgi:hypothetical protein
MVQHWLIFLFFLSLTGTGYAQDERYYRQILTGELPKASQNNGERPVAQFNVSGTGYKFDLDGDKIEETIIPQKRDGIDWLEIRNYSETKIFEAKLFAMGSLSSIYKIKVANLNSKVKAVIIFLDEGQTAGKRFESTARIYVLTFENNDLGTLSMTEGPHFFHEKEAQREQYWRRDYMVNIYDIDGDGTREIAVQYNHIQRIMKYLGKGTWERF